MLNDDLMTQMTQLRITESLRAGENEKRTLDFFFRPPEGFFKTLGHRSFWLYAPYID